jgi:hypothetical protein
MMRGVVLLSSSLRDVGWETWVQDVLGVGHKSLTLGFIGLEPLLRQTH